MKNHLSLLVALVSVVCVTASGEILDRASGVKIGQRMTLRPYVSMSLGYDSNVRSSHGNTDSDCEWTVSPGLGLSYDAETWSLLLTGYYNYRQYFKSENSSYNHHSYGEDLRWNWANSTGADKGWALILGESYQRITAADSMTLSDGRGYNSDSQQFQITGAIQRRFNESWHGDVNGSYYWLDYLNDTKYAGAMYGWDRWTVGGDVGFAPSRWIDLLLSGSYQGYTQDNASGLRSLSGDSRGVTVQGGFGSYMTERISYRVLAGWSQFEYGGGSSDNGFTYTVSGNWKIGESWNTMLLGSSYYQPSERQYASQARVDAISWGLSKLMVRGKLRLTLDLRYRHETTEYQANDQAVDQDYKLNIVTARLGGNYSLNRFLALFLYGEYQQSWNDEASTRQNAYDYDRWRVVGGFRLSY